MVKNIVVCCDGTSNDVTGVSTNVLKLYRCLQRNPSQLTYYLPGVGTVADPTMKTGMGKWWSKKLNMGIGHSVRESACDIYRFLSRHYEPGDRIYLFGFSRGAYTVRTVAGMICFLGLLRREQLGLEQYAWSIYADDGQMLEESERFRAANRFHKCFCTRSKPKIHFIGVWDTVSSFGWLWNLRTLPFTAKNKLLRHIRHAVAKDERRAMFQPNLFATQQNAETFEQVWFPGSHGDVGGGWPEEVSGISRKTLEWMATAAAAQGLELNQAELDRFIGGSQGPAAKICVNESLRGWWWLIELLPRRTWSGTRQRVAWTWPNLGRRRKAPKGASMVDFPQR